MMLRRVTIKQVAQEAGVSTQTISRVINDRPDVAPDTRQRVLAVIDRLGYQPSALARSLIRQRTHTLGVVIAGLRYIGPSRTLNGITAPRPKSWATPYCSKNYPTLIRRILSLSLMLCYPGRWMALFGLSLRSVIIEIGCKSACPVYPCRLSS